MAKKLITRSIALGIEAGTFTGIFRRLRRKEKGYNFADISVLRQLLSNERARMLYTLKNKSPSSIYNLAKLLGRDFKSVRQDVKLLEKFGFLELESTSKGKREMLKPVLITDKFIITITL